MTVALSALADRLRRETGLALDAADGGALSGAVGRLAAGDAAELLRRLDDAVEGRALLTRLVDEVTVQESWLFRHPDELAAIDWAEHAEAARARGDDRVRVWVAGCAGGEEAYSLAILALEALGGERPAEVLATDIASRALATAGAGRYRARRLAQTSERRRRRWFAGPDDAEELAVREEVRRLVRFEPHNLVRDPIPPRAGSRFDVVTCRNVLIYLERTDAERAAAALRGTLHPGGRLVLGAADRLGGVAAAGRPPTAALRPRAERRSPARRRARARGRGAAAGAREGRLRLDARAHLDAGRAALARGDADEAVRALRRALYLDPDSVDAAFELSRAHAAAGDEQGARRALWTALRVAEEAGAADPDFVAACRARLTAEASR